MRDKHPSQLRHETLINFLNQLEDSKTEGEPLFRTIEKTIPTGEVQYINTSDINMAVISHFA